MAELSVPREGTCERTFSPTLADQAGASHGPATTVMGTLLCLQVPPLSLCPSHAVSQLHCFASEAIVPEGEVTRSGLRRPPRAHPVTPQLTSTPGRTPHNSLRPLCLPWSCPLAGPATGARGGLGTGCSGGPAPRGAVPSPDRAPPISAPWVPPLDPLRGPHVAPPALFFSPWDGASQACEAHCPGRRGTYLPGPR